MQSPDENQKKLVRSSNPGKNGYLSSEKPQFLATGVFYNANLLIFTKANFDLNVSLQLPVVVEMG